MLPRRREGRHSGLRARPRSLAEQLVNREHLGATGARKSYGSVADVAQCAWP
jgi:hypothetical protein